MKPTLVVLAAGMGSRYGGLKQIDPVGPSGEIIIDYSIYDAIRAGFDKVVFIIRKDIEETFRENIGSRFENLLQVEYAFQEIDDIPGGFNVPEERKKPWGTGHALLAVKDLVKSPFAVINADDFYGKQGFKLIADYLNAAAENNYCMVGFILEKTLSENGTVARGVCSTDENSSLLTVTEMTEIRKDGDVVICNNNGKADKLTGNEYVSMNMWGAFPTIFIELEKMFTEFLKENINNCKAEFYLPFAIDEMIKKNIADVKVLKSSDSWFGITYKEDKPGVVASVKKLIENGSYPNPLFERR